MKLSFKQHLITSIACTLAFALVLVACGGGHNGGSILNMGNQVKLVLANTPIPGANIFSRSDSKMSLAAMFQTSTPVVASTFAQSFHGACFDSSVLPTNNSGINELVPLPGIESGAPCNSFFSDAQTNQGVTVIDSGMLSALIVIGTGTIAQDGQVQVYVNGVAAQSLTCTVGLGPRCQARNQTVLVNDGDKINVYQVVAPGKKAIPMEVYLVKN